MKILHTFGRPFDCTLGCYFQRQRKLQTLLFRRNEAFTKINKKDLQNWKKNLKNYNKMQTCKINDKNENSNIALLTLGGIKKMLNNFVNKSPTHLIICN